MPDDPQFHGGREVNIHCHMPLPNALADLVREEKQTLRGLYDQLLNISEQLQRSCNANRMLEDRVAQMLDEQKMQWKQSSALIEEQKIAQCWRSVSQFWRSVSQYGEINRKNWEKSMEQWQRHDSAVGPLRQTNTTASVRRSASEARLDDESRIASRRKTHGVTDFRPVSKAAAKAVPPPGPPPSQLLDPVPPPGPPPGPPPATAAERYHAKLLHGSTIPQQYLGPYYIQSYLDLYHSSPRPSRDSRFSAATVPEVKEEPLSEPLSPLSEEDII